jgi:hypothetical protein
MLTLADLPTGGEICDVIVAQSYAGLEAVVTLESHLGEATWGQLFTQSSVSRANHLPSVNDDTL